MSEIYKLLNKIQINLDAPKSQFNKSYSYHYRNAEDILSGVKKHIGDGCILLKDEPVQFSENLILMKSTAILRLGDESVENSAYVEIPDQMNRIQGAQKWTAISSYCRKMALTGLFACDDSKDLDTLNDNNKLEAATSKKTDIKNQYKEKLKNQEKLENQEEAKKGKKVTELVSILRTYTSNWKDEPAVSELKELFKVKDLKDLCNRSPYGLDEAISIVTTKLLGQTERLKEG